MPDGNRNLSSSNVCKRCNNSVTTGHKCRKCGIVSHKSCLKTIKAIFYDDSTVDCCSTNLASVKSSNAANIEATDITVDAEKSVEQIKILYLEEIVRQKDLVIKNQAMLVESLQAQITLLNRNIQIQTENTVNTPSTSDSGSYSKVMSKGISKTVNNDLAKQQFTTQIKSTDVSRALHVAQASRVCNDVVNLTSDLKAKSQKTQKVQRKSRKLLVGSADNDRENSNFKAAKVVQMKHFHITNCDPGTTQEALTLYLKNIVSSVLVEPLNSRNPVQYSSFKISIPTDDASMILKPELWPSGVVINHFFRAKQQSKSNTKES